MHATIPAFAQNINDLLTIFGGDRQRAARHAQTEWRRLPPAEMSCIDQRLRRKGSSVEALVRRGVKPSAARLIELRFSCRQSAEGVQTGTAPALATDTIASSTPNVPVSNQTEPKDAGVTLPSSAESVGAESVRAQPVGAESVARVAEERVQQGNGQLKDSLQESSMGWSSAAFLVAVMAVAVLLGLVVRLFMRWRRTLPVSATTNMPNKNLEGEEGKAPSLTTIGKTSEVVMPISPTLADRMIQLPDETGQSAAISMSQNSARSNKIETTNEEVLPHTVLSKASELSAADSSDVSKVAQLAKLYAMGTPSEKEFHRLKGLISQSLRNSQAPI
jgi:hypothetical protein